MTPVLIAPRGPTDAHADVTAVLYRRVLACVDSPESARRVLPHAAAMAHVLNAPLTLLQVIESPPAGSTAPDPVEWEIRCREVRANLERLANQHPHGLRDIEVALVDGDPAEQIRQWACEHQAAVIVLGTGGRRGAKKARRLGSTARNLVGLECGSLLLVPTDGTWVPTGSYRRLMVPLDGSCRAESVLPQAVRLARAGDAEILLAHVVPSPELTEIGPLETEDLDLRDRVIRRNQRVAQSYLNRIQAGLVDNGLTARSVVLRNGDARTALIDLAIREHADLIILAAHGHSGRRDVPYGSLTGYMVNHAPVPLLVVREDASGPTVRFASSDTPAKVRTPDRVSL